MKIGPYAIRAIETGRFALDGGAMFGVVPQVMWSKTNPPDERNRITMASRCLLICGDGKNILVDAGVGTKLDDKLKGIYRIDYAHSSLDRSLASVGLSVNDITHVILTHLHFDHAGGSTHIQHGKLVPTFPKARYLVQKDQWDRALNPSEKDRASFFQDDYLPLREHGVLDLVEGEGELFPGIGVILCHGHTDAQQLPRITDGVRTVVYCADLFPTKSHIPLPYVMAYDLRPLLTIEEKKKVLPKAYEAGWTLVLQHDPDTEAVAIGSTDRGFVVSETFVID